MSPGTGLKARQPRKGSSDDESTAERDSQRRRLLSDYALHNCQFRFEPALFLYQTNLIFINKPLGLRSRIALSQRHAYVSAPIASPSFITQAEDMRLRCIVWFCGKAHFLRKYCVKAASKWPAVCQETSSVPAIQAIRVYLRTFSRANTPTALLYCCWDYMWFRGKPQLLRKTMMRGQALPQVVETFALKGQRAWLRWTIKTYSVKTHLLLPRNRHGGCTGWEAREGFCARRTTWRSRPLSVRTPRSQQTRNCCLHEILSFMKISSTALNS